MSTNDQPLYENRDPLGTILRDSRINAVLKQLQKGNLLDIACGDNHLVRSFGSGIGIDIFNYKNVDIVLPNFLDLPFESSSIDNVTILAAINYFDQPLEVLKEIHRIMRDDGKLIVTQLYKPLSTVWHQFRDKQLPRPAYSESELTTLLTRANLKITQKSSFMLGANQLYIIRK